MINFSRIPIHQAIEETGINVPYLDISERDEPIEYLFTLGDEHELIARGNLHCLRGAPKVGKSAAGLAFITAALKGEFIGIKANSSNSVVLWIDTEQDKHTLREKARAVLDMAGMEAQPENLKIVSLRGYGTPAETLAVTLQAIDENFADFVFLDGVVDLCAGFNDEEQSRETIRQLENKAEQTGSAILCLIHTNKKDNEARGHLGAIIQQKSAEIYQVNKAEGESVATVTQPLSRFAPIPDFYFAFTEGFKITSIKDILQRAKDEEREKLNELFGKLFLGRIKISSGELKEAYKETRGCQNRTAEKDMKTAVEEGILVKNQDGRNVYYTYRFPDISDLQDADEEI